MLSRRSVRIKVLQLLYMLNRDAESDPNNAVKAYNDGIWQTYEAYIFQLYLFMRVAQYSETDAKNKATKLLPNEEDKAFKPNLYQNDSMRSLSENVGFRKLVDKFNTANNIDEDFIRTLYVAFDATPEYNVYTQIPNPTTEENNKILLELYRFLSSHDLFIEMTDDRFAYWPDDETLVLGAVKKTLKTMPLDSIFYVEHEPNDETVRAYGEELLIRTHEDDKKLLREIEPLLKNWDADRVAVLDMIMIKMALAEMLYFPTIPTKVTLNEYVEISKNYSTDKSKEFINGILDRLMKKLLEENRIQKEGRGLID